MTDLERKIEEFTDAYGTMMDCADGFQEKVIQLPWLRQAFKDKRIFFMPGQEEINSVLAKCGQRSSSTAEAIIEFLGRERG